MVKDKVEWKPQVSLGNVLTILILLGGGIGVWTRLEINDGRQDERINHIDQRLRTLEAARIAAADRIAVELSMMNTRLSKIEGYLTHMPASKP